MFSWTSLLYSGDDVSNVNVCDMPLVLPVFSLFSKTIVAGPGFAVAGAEAYSSMRSSAVHVNTCCCAGRWAEVDTASPVPGLAPAGASHRENRAAQRPITAAPRAPFGGRTRRFASNRRTIENSTSQVPGV